jgi:crotonobetaine/carnitine-CoA ligase
VAAKTIKGPAWDRVPAELRELDTADLTLPHMLRLQAERHGDRPLLRAGETRRSYAEMADAVALAAGHLAVAGVVAGDRIAVMAPNGVEALDLLLGCGWIGAVPVMINVAARGKPLEHILRTSRARLIAVDPELLGALEVLDPAELELERIWTLGDRDPQLTELAGLPVGPVPAVGDPVEPGNVGPGDVAVIIFTSGTTGPSKGVRCLQGQLFWWGVNTGWNLELGPDDVLYTCLPLFHTNALSAFVQALVFGGEFHLGPRFSASRFWSRVAESGATVTYLLGAMVRILAEREPGPDDRRHRTRIALSPATPAELHERFAERFGITLLEGYGSSETNHVIGVLHAEQRPGRLGRPLPGFEIAVVDQFDQPLSPGEAGELILRAEEPFSFADGYERMPEKTVETWRNLWFHSGDRVIEEPDGTLRFLDRIKDSIRRRGENISSYEVEEAVSGHPAVAESAVFPVPSELAEDEVMAAIVVNAGETLEPADLVAWLEPRLAAYAIPRYVDVVAELPHTENGKIRKTELRAQGVTAATWDREKASN